jgi:type IV fimbrial biogenesis protein FimT|tara:strand:- start:1632 stop:2087 length:456 start_codon:yes stop_codon:yes gene_type:complete
MVVNMRKQQGFTLTELLVTLAILGILSLVAIPSFLEQLKYNRLISNTNQLLAVFKFARSEAAKRDRTVTLKKSDDEWHIIIDGQVEPLKKFQPSHESITVNTLKDLTITATGEVQGNDNQFLITDSDTSTVDFCLNILTSGQVQRTNTNTC